MPLDPILTSTDTAAEEAAQGIANVLRNAARQVNEQLTKGKPLQPEVAPTLLGNGNVTPGRSARPAITPEQIRAKMPKSMVAIVDRFLADVLPPPASAEESPSK